jgi:hypothetical protein
MTSLRVVVVVVALAVTSACASSQTLQVADEARYRGDRELILETVVDTVRANKYEVTDLDPATGLIVTRDRWYEKDGTFEDKQLASDVGILVEDGSILLRYEVRVRQTGLEHKVEIKPIIAQARTGYAVPFKLAPDDLTVPGWVHGKTEKLTLAIYEALAPYRANDPTVQR